MPPKNTAAENRSKVAVACLDFGSHLLGVRAGSVTSDDAQRSVKELFDWFAEHDAFTPGNAEIAIHAIDFGKELLTNRKTAIVQDAIDAIQRLFTDLAE